MQLKTKADDALKRETTSHRAETLNRTGSFSSDGFVKHNFMLLGLDRVVDFATLGEYRVVTGQPLREVRDQDIWATDIEWDSNNDWNSAKRERVACALPRARDRKLARDRVRG